MNETREAFVRLIVLGTFTNDVTFLGEGELEGLEKATYSHDTFYMISEQNLKKLIYRSWL